VIDRSKESENVCLDLIETLYKVLDPYTMFSKAKEYSWQTLFHHIASVASASCRFGLVAKRQKDDGGSDLFTSWKRLIEVVEMQFNNLLKYEEILFLVGVAHDYIKFHDYSRDSLRRDRVERILRKIIASIHKGLAESKRAEIERLYSKIVELGDAVDSVSSPRVDNTLLDIVVSVVKLMDNLHSAKSIDDALKFIRSGLARRIEDIFGVRFGFLKVSTQTLLKSVVSEEIVEKVREYGWEPLVAFSDGMIFVGRRNTVKRIPLKELVDIIVNKLGGTSTDDVRDAFCELLGMLRKKMIASITNLVIELVNEYRSGKIDTKSLKEAIRREIETIKKLPQKDRGKGRDEKYKHIANLYAYLAALYVVSDGREIDTVIEIAEQKQFSINPKKLATGLGDGSTYFMDYIKQRNIVITRDVLLRALMDLIEAEGIEETVPLILYTTAFIDKDRIVKDVGKKMRSDVNIRNLNALRIVILCEVLRRVLNAGGGDRLRAAIENIVSVIPVEEGSDIEECVEEFVAEAVSGDIIEGAKKYSWIGDSPYATYCRICRRPMYRDDLTFKMYGKVMKIGSETQGRSKSGRRGRKGEEMGISEIWLPDDVPLANIETVAGSSSSERSVRHVCRLCLYEANLLREKFFPPFLVFAMHPVASTDLLTFVKKRIDRIGDLITAIVIPRDVDYSRIAEAYRSIVLGDDDSILLKIDFDRLEKVLGLTPRETKNVLIVYDPLGAKFVIPLGDRDLAMKKKHVALTLLLAPLAIAIAGGGQAALVSDLGSVAEIGTQRTPILLPFSVSMISRAVAPFEEFLRISKREGRRILPSEYEIYGRSYVTLLMTLFSYAIRVFSWYPMWKRTHGAYTKTVHDYSLQMLMYMDLSPILPLAIVSAPTESLEPRSKESRRTGIRLPYFSELIYIASEVEKILTSAHQNQPERASKQRRAKGELIKALCEYAEMLRKASGGAVLSRYRVQKPLRLGLLKVLKEYENAIDLISIKSIAAAEFMSALRSTVGTERLSSEDLERPENVFNTIARYVIMVQRKTSPGKARKFVEILLDTVYELYRSSRRRITEKNRESSLSAEPRSESG